MKKNIVIIISIAVLVLAVVLVVMMMQNRDVSSPSQNDTNNSSQSSDTNNNNSSARDARETTTDKVSIKNSDFSPTKIIVKKGTTVTWTNEDSMGHNVVASDSSRTGGLPMDAPLLEKGQTFTHTFNEVGVFPYTCTPHPFMRGAVEVIE